MAYRQTPGRGPTATFKNVTALLGPTVTEGGEVDPETGVKTEKTDAKAPVKPGEIPIAGSKKAESQKANLAKVGVEKQVKLKSDELGGFGSGEDMGVKKYTSFYKASTPELKEKGNKYWSSLSETEKQTIRDKQSRYEKDPIPMERIEAKLIPSSSSLKIQRIPLETPGEFTPPDKSIIKSRKEIKRETIGQYGGTYRPRYGLRKTQLKNNRRSSQLLTRVFGMKNVKSASAEKHYDEQLALRREQKHANRKTNKWLDLSQATKNFRDVFNKPGNVKVKTKTFTKKVKLGKNRLT